jgi:hypothetical protein
VTEDRPEFLFRAYGFPRQDTLVAQLGNGDEISKRWLVSGEKGRAAWEAYELGYKVVTRRGMVMGKVPMEILEKHGIAKELTYDEFMELSATST